ncbi:uncharacterized protein F5147DRAFT_747828 [Suillus discolor]|uniref:Uncharacterized protein n=1 Tax=Suillus discolor TaxID=1912936 RepID=A0A9P7JP11_9AGAM|nr:uncharacterized protein F5147DRAFT_747828 [Suillus discolor]KAG2094206.1 hypothetical protein F5147DRAFT_747828 [Suillus discolor]
MERLIKEWNSPIYTFFDPIPAIETINGRRAHAFKCMAKGCKVRICRFLDKKDAHLTSNMRKHIKSCWGEGVLEAACEAKNTEEVRTKIVTSILCNGSITSSFERKGKGKVTYSHRQHTRTETKGFQSLMKTGRPEYYIPSPRTISRDVRLQIAKMLQEYEGRMNFTTDAWTSENHRAFVAVAVHLEHEGVPLSFPLDIVEVATVRKSLTLTIVHIMIHSH